MLKSHITVGFCTDLKNKISSAIRFFSWSRFSHVVLISPDRYSYIESTHEAGVREMPIGKFFEKDNLELGLIRHPNPNLVWEYAKKEVGKPYDQLYIYWWLLRRPSPKLNGGWSCSELIPGLCKKAGYDILRSDYNTKVTPEHLYMLSKPYPKDESILGNYSYEC